MPCMNPHTRANASVCQNKFFGNASLDNVKTAWKDNRRRTKTVEQRLAKYKNASLDNVKTAW